MARQSSCRSSLRLQCSWLSSMPVMLWCSIPFKIRYQFPSFCSIRSPNTLSETSSSIWKSPVSDLWSDRKIWDMWTTRSPKAELNFSYLLVFTFLERHFTSMTLHDLEVIIQELFESESASATMKLLGQCASSLLWSASWDHTHRTWKKSTFLDFVHP